MLQAPQVESAVREVEATAGKVDTAGGDLEATATSGEDLDIIAAFLELGVTLVQFYVALDRLVTSVRANVTAGTVPDPAARTAAEQFADNLAKILSDVILASAITDRAPQIGFVLRLLGLIDWRRVSRQAEQPAQHRTCAEKARTQSGQRLIQRSRGALQAGNGVG